jgi:hypothetical protein
MSCVIRAYGKDFDVDAFLKHSTLVPLVVARRGEGRAPNSRNPALRRHEQSGVNISVSTREFSDLEGQIEDAMRFLSANESELHRLRDSPGLEGISLDFPIEERDVIFQSDTFPARLLSLLGDLDIALVVSRYPMPNPEPPTA